MALPYAVLVNSAVSSDASVWSRRWQRTLLVLRVRVSWAPTATRYCSRKRLARRSCGSCSRLTSLTSTCTLFLTLVSSRACYATSSVSVVSALLIPVSRSVLALPELYEAVPLRPGNDGGAARVQQVSERCAPASNTRGPSSPACGVVARPEAGRAGCRSRRGRGRCVE